MENIKQLIETYDTIIIHRHVNPDPDALGSQGGLYELLRHHYPNKRILKGGENAETLAFLTTMDQVTEKDYHNALIIVTDTGNHERIDGNHEWMKHAATMIKIDHHPDVDAYAPHQYVQTTASSTSEIIYDLHKVCGFEMIPAAARLIYAGIVGDTGRFLFSNTTPHTMTVAADLIRYDFDFTTLSRQFTESKESVARLSGYVQTHFEINDSGIAHIIVTRDLLKQYGVTSEETASMVGLMGQVDTVKAWVFFIEKEEGGYRARLRSKQIPISEVACRHHGGGHPLASGANAEDEAEIQDIIQEMTNVVNAHA